MLQTAFRARCAWRARKLRRVALLRMQAGFYTWLLPYWLASLVAVAAVQPFVRGSSLLTSNGFFRNKRATAFLRGSSRTGFLLSEPWHQLVLYARALKIDPGSSRQGRDDAGHDIK